MGFFASRQSAPKACGQLLSSRPFVLVFCRGVTVSLKGGVSLRHTGAETGRKPKLAGSGQSLT